jgi:hypothetical protein
MMKLFALELLLILLLRRDSLIVKCFYSTVSVPTKEYQRVNTVYSQSSHQILPRKRENLNVGIFSSIFLLFTKKASASGLPNVVITKKLSSVQGIFLWCALFLLSAGLHSAESAITKLSPWKVRIAQRCFDQRLL